MKELKKSTLMMALVGISCSLANVSVFADSEVKRPGVVSITLDCDKKPSALKKWLTRKPNKALDITVSGMCLGPIGVDRTHKTTIRSDASNRSGIFQPHTNEVSDTVTVSGSKIELIGLHFDVSPKVTVLKLEHNASAVIDRLTSNYHLGHSTHKPSIEVLGSSTLVVTNQVAIDVRVRGGSFAQFIKGSQQTSLIISDTSSVLAQASSEFERIDLWGNAHLETNSGVSIDALSLFGQSTAELLSSQVAQLTLGGRTMFAAYDQSTVTGPYTFYTDNYIFEIVGSSLDNWTSQNDDNALTIGNNATVNGQTYAGWTWTGQDGSVTEP